MSKATKFLPDDDGEESDAYALVRHVAETCRVDSWRKLNETLTGALRLAVSANIQFDLGDFERIDTNMRGSHWLGDREGWYALAVASGNTSACLSLEAYLERPPFIWQQKRLARGSLWSWPPHPVPLLVTSLTATSILGCTYKDKNGDETHALHGYPPSGPEGVVKICRRIKVERDVFQAHPERTG